MKTTTVALFISMILLMGCNSEQQSGSGVATQEEQTQAQHADSASSVQQEVVTDASELKQSTSELTTVTQKNNHHLPEKTQAQQPEFASNKNTGTTVQPAVPPVQPLSLKAEAKKFCDFFKTVDEPSQFYDVPAKEVKEVKGKSGTVILINPDDLVTLKNKDVDKPIEVELKELTNQKQLLKANAQTICDGKLLVSGGAYYINLKSEGEPVKLKPGKSLSVRFPKLTHEPMTLFAGYRDSLGQMQWQQRRQTFRADPLQQAWRDSRNVMVQYDGDILEIDTLPKRKQKEKTEKERKVDQAYEKVYSAMEIQSLGWINCDRFYNVPDKTNLSINMDNRDKIAFASIYLVFEDINSLMQTHYGATPNGVSNPGFENIPVGAKVRLVAFSLKDDKLMAYSTNITIKKNETVAVSLKDVSDEELKTLLAKK